MSRVRIEKITIPGYNPPENSWYPGIRELIESEVSIKLDENDGLFIGHGMFKDNLPYTMQDGYDREEKELVFDSCVLENRYLKAVFIPALGGRLWSCFDKEHNRELILANTALKPGNLAIRNAWFAGGVEFNIGRRGHDEQTMSQRFAEVIHGRDYDALRIYEYQRDRGTPFQYDCFLPEDSRFLFIRGRIVNPNSETVPMYWWSNIAVADVKGSRVVVPADEAFANVYQGGKLVAGKVKLPDGEGFDATYPENFPVARDHFYNIPENHRLYECIFYPDGYGFCHLSTRRMRGRKLFVWGKHGKKNWNKKLLGPNLDGYIELQGGLGRSQQECLPMPPHTAWEWLEAYGSLVMAPQDVFGSWQDAVDNTTSAINEMFPESELDKILAETKESIALANGEIICRGSGWGALAETMRGEKLTANLDFGETGEEQYQWVELMQKGKITCSFPRSYQVSDAFFELLKKAEPSWQVALHLAVNYVRRNDLERAEQQILSCNDISDNRHLLYVLANIRTMQKRNSEAAELILKAGLLDVNDAPFVKEVLKMLLSFKAYDLMRHLINELPQWVIDVPYINMLRAYVLVHEGALDEAEKILFASALDIPDIREGECSTSQLYVEIVCARARLEGKTIDPDDVEIPYEIDLRMSTNKQ